MNLLTYLYTIRTHDLLINVEHSRFNGDGDEFYGDGVGWGCSQWGWGGDGEVFVGMGLISTILSLFIRNCDLQSTGSNPDHRAADSDCNSGQVAYTHVPLSPCSIIWYQPMVGDALRLGR